MEVIEQTIQYCLLEIRNSEPLRSVHVANELNIRRQAAMVLKFQSQKSKNLTTQLH